MLCLDVETSTHPQAEEIVVTLPGGGEITFRLLPPQGGREVGWRRRVGVTAPAELKISRRRILPAEEARKRLYVRDREE